MPLARKYFGLQFQNLTVELSGTLGFEAGSGVLVADVDPRSPAENTGIKRGFVIDPVGRYPVNSVERLEELMEVVTSGSQVDFTVGLVRQVRGQNLRQLQTVSLNAR